MASFEIRGVYIEKRIEPTTQLDARTPEQRNQKNVTLPHVRNVLLKATADKYNTIKRRRNFVTDTLIINTEMSLLHH